MTLRLCQDESRRLGTTLLLLGLGLGMAACGSGQPSTQISTVDEPGGSLDPDRLPDDPGDPADATDEAGPDATGSGGDTADPMPDVEEPDVGPEPDTDEPPLDDVTPDAGPPVPDVPPSEEVDAADPPVEDVLDAEDAGPEDDADAGPDPDPDAGCQSAADCPSDELGVCEVPTCVGGACGVGPAPVGAACSDPDSPMMAACVESLCDELGACVATPLAGGACEDGDPCTTGETCGEDGMCSGGLPVVCQPPGPCELALCDPAAGGCVGIPANPGLPCEDGDPCTVGTTCGLDGSCAGGENLCECDDDDGCPDDGNVCNGVPTCEPLPEGGKGCVIDPSTVITCPMTADPCFATTCEPASGGCTTIALPGALCSDGDGCTVNDTCDDDGFCAGKKLECGDGNPCTEDACEPSVGICLHIALDESPCQDGDGCTTGDVCVAGECLGELKTCDDGDPCTVDTCDSGDGSCTSSATSGGVCDDGSACTEGDTCLFGVCVGKKVDCDDGSGCTLDACAPDTGCSHEVLDGAGCDDGSACTEGDTCDGAGTCIGAPVDCGDGVPCTQDLCDPAVGCEHVPDDAACEDTEACTDGACDPASGCVQLPAEGGCDDGDPCTTGDACAGGACVGSPVACNDDVPCTADACEPGVGCVHTPTDGACEDGNPCTLAVCDAAAGGCVVQALDGGACDDGDACTVGEVCVGGVCQSDVNQCPCTVDADCDDGNACNGVFACQPTGPDGLTECVQTAGSVACDAADTGNPCLATGCDPVDGACKPLPVADGTPCPDNEPCTAGEECFGGTCFSAATDCDDGVGCTLDACEPDVGCTHTPDQTACDDGVACTSDSCHPVDDCRFTANVHLCKDGVSCTVDVCDPEVGCVYTPDDVACHDDVACTLDACDPTEDCAHTPDHGYCDDGDPCTADTCSSTGGCQYAPADGPCEDGNPCTLGDTCADGGCLAGTPKACPTGDDCLAGACDPQTGECLVTPKADGSACSDGDACTEPDGCVDGACVGGPQAECDDGIPCTIDGCHEVEGCIFGPDDDACDDGNACTLDLCVVGQGCVYEPLADFVACDDGIAGTDPDVCIDGTCRGVQPVHIPIDAPLWCEVTEARAHQVADLDGNFFAIVAYGQDGPLCSSVKSRVVHIVGAQPPTTVASSDQPGELTAIDHDLVLGADGEVGRLVFGGSYLDTFLSDVLIALGAAGLPSGPWGGLWASRLPGDGGAVAYYLAGRNVLDTEGRVVRCLRDDEDEVTCELLEDAVSAEDWEELDPVSVSGLLDDVGVAGTAVLASIPGNQTVVLGAGEDDIYDKTSPPDPGVLRDIVHLGGHGVWVVGSGGRLQRRLDGVWTDLDGPSVAQGLDLRAVGRVRKSLMAVGHKGGEAWLISLPLGADPEDPSAWTSVSLGKDRGAYELHATEQTLVIVGQANGDGEKAWLWTVSW